MYFYDLTEFLRLSAVLNYQLSARPVIWENILSIIVGGKSISERDHTTLLRVFEYLGEVYGQKKRRLGSLSILHPLRATTLLSQTYEELNLIDFMTELLHDNFEDIKPRNVAISRWIKGNKFKVFLENIDPETQEILFQRLEWLTKDPDETYYHYIGRLLEKAIQHPEIVRIKLADRLDNTLDMRIDLEDTLEKVDFFETTYQVMFTKTYPGYKPEMPHPPSTSFDGAHRLYQLFKNTVLMSLIRRRQVAVEDDAAREIFMHLAKASMKEAQRNVLHIFGYHLLSVPKLRDLFIETLEYVQKGGIDAITSPASDFRLDGLFMSRFDTPRKKLREKRLTELYRDKPLMIEASIAFIVIFLSFMNDPTYFVRGISENGVRPEN